MESGCQSYLYGCMGGRIVNFVHASPPQPSAAVHTYGWHLILKELKEPETQVQPQIMNIDEVISNLQSTIKLVFRVNGNMLITLKF